MNENETPSQEVVSADPVQPIAPAEEQSRCPVKRWLKRWEVLTWRQAAKAAAIGLLIGLLLGVAAQLHDGGIQ